MSIQRRLAAGLFTAIMALASCHSNPIAQKGYGRIKADIKSSMVAPSTYKGESVECYWDVQTITYAYQYKITFSGENALGGRISATVYYGYSDGNDAVRKYGSDSSYFSVASKRGEKQTVAA